MREEEEVDHRPGTEADEEPERELKLDDDVLSSAGEHGVVLVDPPRAGLDPDTLALVRRFRSIVYIACDARSLRRDLHDRGLGVGRRSCWPCQHGPGRFFNIF